MPAFSLHQTLPELGGAPNSHQDRQIIRKLRNSVQTQTVARDDYNSDEQLPSIALVPNSALVHQCASKTAGENLAAASVKTAVSLPLMIGCRSKCVINLVDDQSAPMSQEPQQSAPFPAQQVAVPQNTATRAEQRRQNMAHVSVVRPVVNIHQQQGGQQQSRQVMSYEPFGQVPAELGQKQQQQQQRNEKSASIIDDWMLFDKNINSKSDPGSILDELIMSSKLDGIGPYSGRSSASNWSQASNGITGTAAQEFVKSEREMRQQILTLRREEHELNRGIMRQHRFLLTKIEERKRYLQIVQSVWMQRDFKHAMEKMLDIYQQGLIFTQDSGEFESKSKRDLKQSELRSLNTSLVVDVVSIIILRPKLWTLEICQLLLPMVNSDLLVQAGREYEYYVEIGLKAIKLIVTHFASILKSTFDSLKESNKSIGIDLSREDRVNKCLSCYKLLLESHAIISATSAGHKQSVRYENVAGQSSKLSSLYHELDTMFVALKSSIGLSPDQLARRFRNER